MANQPVIIRFASSLPDLRLLILATYESTSSPPIEGKVIAYDHSLLAIKHAIRAHLPADSQNRGLRLIQAGRVLNDAETVEQALRLKGKGKGASEAALRGSKTEAPPIYIHCVLSSEDAPPSTLSAESAAATTPTIPATTPSHPPTTSTSPTASPSSLLSQSPHPPAQPIAPAQPAPPDPPESRAPQGFSRLLAAGFTPQDVAMLRAQFRGMTASRHTPDTMPSPNSLLRMEEQWLDSGSAPSTAAGASADGQGSGNGSGSAVVDEDSPSQALNDMLLGIMAGFFWPIGALVWGLREEGVWSRRRGWAVVGGVAVNVAFGVVRVLG